ncbi:MAG: tRNA (N6-threonylcarbamoyladenosine(37)-N6)-methyltransferase TrmO [Victivallales bacterium]|nr:tRNA (N6-threonylcarbamoyladenosine(37)-N6)-methyltransferase TrmO [Victivallales bacterium]
MNPTTTFSFTPIGYVHCPQKYRYEAPRQAVFAGNAGTIELLPHHNYETALRELETFDRIWVIFAFHLNRNWKPTVRPPVAGEKEKVGVFASRSPHRPNPIGMSCVELDGISRLTLHIRNFDLLDGTPVLDLKPYIVRADCFPDAATGWLPERLPQEWRLQFTPTAVAQMSFIRDNSGLDLENFAIVQLRNSPLHKSRKRVTANADGTYMIACRTWRICFRPDPDTLQVRVLRIESSYPGEELAPERPDVYGDKDVHRAFLTRFETAAAVEEKTHDFGSGA